MQATTELLAPSHFTLLPPASFSRADAENIYTHGRVKPVSIAPARAETTIQSAGDREPSRSAAWQSDERLRADRAEHVPPEPKRTEQYRETDDCGVRVATRNVRGVTAAKTVVVAGASAEDLRLSLPNARSREAEERMLSAWLPRKQRSDVGKNPPAASPSTAACPSSASQKAHSSSLRAREYVKPDSKTESHSPRYEQGQVEDECEDNTVEALARSLARCQKIDKSLKYYAGFREKWREKPHESTSEAGPGKEVTLSETRHARARENSACAKNQATPAEARSSQKRFLAEEKSSEQHSLLREPIRGVLDSKKAFGAPTTALRSGTIESSPERHLPSQQRLSRAGKASRQPLNDLNSLPHDTKRKTDAVAVPTLVHTPVSVSLLHGNAPRVATNTAKRLRPKEVEKVRSPSANAVLPITTTQQAISVPLKQRTLRASSPALQLERYSQDKLELAEDSSVTKPLEGDDEEEFNDFDSVLQDSNSELVEPQSGTFGKPVLTGARPVSTPPSPVKVAKGTPKQKYLSQTSSEPEVVQKEAFTSTCNDTEIARILQAEEESKAGVSLQPNTSNDLAIARQIQEEFCQQAGVRVVRVSTRGAAAEGRGAPGVMTYKSNFESMRFLSDDPTYFDRGYELGREFIVNDHNSPTFEQKEKNRNIPRKSVRKNNYSSRWDDEYRYRGFDERGYRNLSTERIQSYELKQWAIGGTGIVTGCVRDMTRSEHLLDREEHDLAFEGRQELKEIESGLDSQIIERVSHVYMYKENHRPKHESVDPVTQCRVCFDDFHEGEPLRLLPCSHTFHRFCIDKWLEDNTDCCVCKADIVVLARQMGVPVDRDKYKKRYW